MRAINFSAGPCTLPLAVLEEAQDELVDYRGRGMSLLEMSHRSPEYEAVHNEALDLSREIFGAPDEFAILFLQGGASLQFAMVPLNLLGPGQQAGYLASGAWGTKALEDAGHHGKAYAAWDGADSGYTTMPGPEDIEVRDNTRYLHVTSNETIHGTRLSEWPNEARLVADMSSDYISRAIPWDRFDLVYGGAQKNLGPAGLTIVFVRHSVLEETNRDLASYLRYDIHAAKNSLYNTPPVFAIYMTGKTLKWIQRQGGLRAIEKAAQARSDLIYDVIDGSDGYYRGPVQPGSRSHMNVVFRLPSEEDEARFLEEAVARNMLNLRGHRSVGGLRASLYNAMPMEGVEALASFMSTFR